MTAVDATPSTTKTYLHGARAADVAKGHDVRRFAEERAR